MSNSGEAITVLMVGVAVVAFLIFLICLCCPFCLLAKYRRRRGHVYSQSQTPVTAHTATTVTQNGTQVIAINNAQRSNASYPVQRSVTVVPLLNPQSQPQPAHYPYGHGGGGDPTGVPYPRYGNVPSPYGGHEPMSMPMPMPNNDLPPPYPGLPRETQTHSTRENNLDQPQPAYNPYYGNTGLIGESNQANSAFVKQ